MLVACPAPSVPGCPVRRLPRRAAPPRGPTTTQASGLGLPEHGLGVARRQRPPNPGACRRLVHRLGLAGFLVTFGWSQRPVPSTWRGTTATLAVWLVLGAISVRLFTFTPGQLALGLRRLRRSPHARRLRPGARAGPVDRARGAAAVHRQRTVADPGQGAPERRRAAVVTSAERCAARRASSPPTALAPWASPQVPCVNQRRQPRLQRVHLLDGDVRQAAWSGGAPAWPAAPHPRRCRPRCRRSGFRRPTGPRASSPAPVAV